jgi:hypothetical protein
MLSVTYRTKGSYFKKRYVLNNIFPTAVRFKRETDLTDGAASVRQGPGKGRRSISRDKKMKQAKEDNERETS